MKNSLASFHRLAVGALLVCSPLYAAESSLILKMPPGWNGFEMEASVVAGYRASGAPSDVLPKSDVQTATVSPHAGLSALEVVAVPRAAASIAPPSGDPADKVSVGLDLEYRLGSATSRDTFHIDFEVNASALDARADFGSGDVKLDAFAEVTVTLRSRAPLRAADCPGAVFSVPDLPALADPANEVMISTFHVPHRDRPSEPASPYEPPPVGFVLPGNPGPDIFLDMRPATTLHLDETLEYTFTFEVVVPYGSSTTTGYTLLGAAGLDRTLVTNPNDSGPGSLREALALVPDSGVVAFDPSLAGQTIHLTSGELLIDGRELIIEARDLAEKVTVDAGGISRVFSIRASEAALNGVIITGGHSPDWGGGILCSQSTVSLTHSCLVNNEAAEGGGIGQIGTSKVLLQRALVASNLASGVGGGFYLDGTSVQRGAFIIDTEFRGNSATRGGALGLTQALDGAEPSIDLDVRNCTFHDNTAVQRGGASFQAKGVFEQCTFFNNSAGTEGGALLTRWATEIRHCTITGNTAPHLFGSGIHAEDGLTTVFSSIIAGNGSTDLDIESGSFASAGFNVVGSGLGAIPFSAATDDIKGIADPLLSPLGDYGGPTPTMLPQANSPAVDAGSTDLNSPDVDQRGLPRRADGDGDGASFVDAGAAESEQALLVVTTNADSGPGSLRQALADVPDGGRILFSPDIAASRVSSDELLVTGKTITIDGGYPIGRDPVVLSGGLIGPRILQVAAGAEVTARNVKFIGGKTDSSGGAILNWGTVHLENCELLDNQATGGGAVSVGFSAVMTMTGCHLSSNQAVNAGAVVNGGVLVMRDSSVVGNTAAGSIGGIWSDGETTTLERCIIANNTGDGAGGAYLSSGALTATQCSFQGNTSRREGGAFAARIDGSATFDHCTFWGNFSHSGGGAIWLSNTNVLLRHCTIAGNGAPEGGGILVAPRSSATPTELRVFSSIVAGNGGDDICHEAGTIMSEGHNVIGSGSGASYFQASGDQVGIIDPKLSPPGFYGGNILSLLPLPGSPALEGGATDALSPTVDQRGQPRVQDGDGDGSVTIDAGAAEAAPPETALRVSNAAESGPGSLRQALQDASVPGTRIHFDPAVDGKALTLTEGLRVTGKQVLIDAGNLPNGFELDGGNDTTVLTIADDAAATLRNITIRNGGPSGPGDDGGGISVEGFLSLDQCVVRDNVRTAQGGGINAFLPDGLVILSSELRNNEATSETGFGGGVAAVRMRTGSIVVDTVIQNNVAARSGGGIDVVQGSLLLRDCVVQGNHGETGGGVSCFSSGSMVIFRSTLDDNSATDIGGGFNCTGYLHALDSTFSRNHARNGGGLRINGTGVLSQSTFFGNTASEMGGAIATAWADLELLHCTVTENDAAQGGGIAVTLNPAPTVLDSSIISRNSNHDLFAASAASEDFVSHGGNVIGTFSGTALTSEADDAVGILDPLLSAPGDYGGLTETLIPLAGSPARDQGRSRFFGFPYDQRGFPRDSSSHPDAGAYEASGSGGFPVWALESIPAGEDMSFGGNADEDRNANGLEYGVGTEGDVSDPGAAENVRVRTTVFDSQLAFGFRPEAFDVVWRVVRSTDLQNWSEIYSFDGATETLIADVTATLDFAGRTITVKDRNPPTPEAYYRLEVDYTP